MSRHYAQQARRYRRARARNLAQADRQTVAMILQRLENTGLLPRWSARPEYAIEREAALQYARKGIYHV